MIVTYICKNCKKPIQKRFINGEKPAFSIDCRDCKEKAYRKFGNITITKEDPSVSGAIQMMLYSSN